MPIQPGTLVKLLHNVPLDNTYRNTLTFANTAEQSSYFIGMKKYEAIAYSYQRLEKDTIRVNIHADYLYDCNYMMYSNAAILGKWIYCFVTGIQYINEQTTEITFELDVMQTWKFDFDVKPCFVEREHTNDDTPGNNLVPENFETGEYICQMHESYANLNGQTLVVASTIDLTGTVTSSTPFTGGGSYSNIYSGCAYFGVDSSSTLNNKIKECATAGQLDAILAVFYAPSIMTGINTGVWKITNAPWVGEWAITGRPTSLNGYTPRNKKLLTFPFCYLRVSNNNGNSEILHFEKFNLPTAPKFELDGCLSINSEISLIPEDYNGTTSEIDQRLKLSGFPQCSWNADLFQNWYALNQASLGTGLIASAFGAVPQALSVPKDENSLMGVVGSGAGKFDVFNVLSTAANVANSVAGFYSKSLEPPTTRGNLNSSNINATMMCNTYEYYIMTVRAQFAKIIDEFFDMYGYKTNRVKLPNITGRKTWNYVKTINSNITGSIPANDLAKIRGIYDRGVTFWHDVTNVGNYSADNSIA